MQKKLKKNTELAIKEIIHLKYGFSLLICFNMGKLLDSILKNRKPYKFLELSKILTFCHISTWDITITTRKPYHFF